MTDLHHLEQNLGFAEIRKRLILSCNTPTGKELASDIRFYTDEEEIFQALSLVSEMKYLLEFKDSIPTLAFSDIREELKRINTPGTAIEIECLITISFITETLININTLFTENAEDIPNLLKLIKTQAFERTLKTRIGSIIDEKGEIRNSASAKLGEIRQEIEKQKRKIEKNIVSILRNLKEKDIVEDNCNLSIRNGRLVIPIPAAKKRSIKGVVLDESSTGQTVFLEPIEIFELNNDIQDLEHEEKREIIKILTIITDEIRPLITQIKKNTEFLGLLDFILAKAKLAISYNAIMPDFSTQNNLLLIQARHPILEESLKKQNKEIVALDIELRSDQRILIISGPNTGGKSVAMKTAGLMQYMFQSGFLIPAVKGSKLFPFNNILCDIGDQQSIENDLSTYSSHLINMKKFIKNGNEKSLVLIDEFGSGTEPESGAAIAEAVLEKLTENMVFGIITTHYFNLKMFASNNEGLTNAAMLFDNKELRPQYVLKIGKPGSSFAVEIAKSIGLPEKLILNASKNIGQGRVEMEKMIQELENEKLKLDKRRQQLELGEKFVSELIEKYEHLNISILEKRDRIINTANREAEQKLSEANALIENTIREIREKDIKKDQIQRIRKDFEKDKKKISSSKTQVLESLPLKQIENKKNVIQEKNLLVGDVVTLIDGIEKGEIIEIKNKKAKVLFSHAQLQIDLSKLIKTKASQSGQKTHRKTTLLQKAESIPSILDLRGKRAEEAISELDKHIDDALLNGISMFSILHGKGQGVLRHVLRQHLNAYKDMLEYKDAHADAGGDGITEIIFI